MAKKILIKPIESYELKAYDYFIDVNQLNDEDYALLDKEGILDFATYISKKDDINSQGIRKSIVGFLKELKRGYKHYTEEELFNALESILDKEDYNHYNSFNDRVKAFWVSITQLGSNDPKYDNLKYFLGLGKDIMPYHHYLTDLFSQKEIYSVSNFKTAIFLKQPLPTFVKMIADKIESQKNRIQFQ